VESEELSREERITKVARYEQKKTTFPCKSGLHFGIAENHQAPLNQPQTI